MPAMGQMGAGEHSRGPHGPSSEDRLKLYLLSLEKVEYVAREFLVKLNLLQLKNKEY